MSTGRYPGRIEFSKAVHKGGDKSQYESVVKHSVMLVKDGVILIDILEGYALEPFARTSTIGGVTGSIPAMSFRLIKKNGG